MVLGIVENWKEKGGVYLLFKVFCVFIIYYLDYNNLMFVFGVKGSFLCCLLVNILVF